MNYLFLGLLQTFLQLLDSEMEGASVFAIGLINIKDNEKKKVNLRPRERPKLNEGSGKLSVEGGLKHTVPTSQSRGT